MTTINSKGADQKRTVVTSDLNDSIYSKCKHERAFIEMLNFYGQEDIQLEVMNINKRKRI